MVTRAIRGWGMTNIVYYIAKQNKYRGFKLQSFSKIDTDIQLNEKHQIPALKSHKTDVQKWKILM